MLEDYPPIMTLSETSEALRKSKNTVIDLIKEKKLHAQREGRIWRIYKDAVLRYLLTETR